MSRIPILCCALCLSWIAVTTYAADKSSPRSDMSIVEMAVTTKIVRGKPIDSVHRISSASVKELYCFTHIRRAEINDTTIRHVWFHDGNVAGDIRLPVKGESWRTFSKRPVDGTAKGAWRVEVMAPDGSVIKSVEFRIN